MRSGKSFFVLSLILAASLALFIFGCSDDSTPTRAQNTQQDQNYAAVADEANEVLDSAVSSFASTLQIYEISTPIDTAITIVYSPINPDSITTENQWHIIYATDLATSFSWSRVDSLQFTRNGHAQTNGFGADAMTLRHHFELEYGDTTGIYRNREGNANLEFTGINTQQATVNGTRNVSVSSRIQVNHADIRRDFDIQMNFEGVTVPKANDNWQYGCPSAGVVTGTVNLTTALGDGTPVESTWDFQATFDNGSVEVTVTTENFTRTYTETLCDM